jgi:hypothetical protein
LLRPAPPEVDGVTLFAEAAPAARRGEGDGTGAVAKFPQPLRRGEPADSLCNIGWDAKHRERRLPLPR